jgi:hypothetical protein
MQWMWPYRSRVKPREILIVRRVTLINLVIVRRVYRNISSLTSKWPTDEKEGEHEQTLSKIEPVSPKPIFDSI